MGYAPLLLFLYLTHLLLLEADDYDPNLNLAAKIVELGLSENTNNEPKLPQQKNVKIRTGKNKLDANSCRDLTEDEKRKAQIESDGQHVVDLFGLYHI